MFVAGTRTLADWARNTLIPLSLTSHLPRYTTLSDAVKGKYKTSRRLVGHSMGGSVALQFAEDHPYRFDTETYGAPVISLSSKHRHRDLFDPISVFDFGADSKHLAFPHSYKGRR